MTDPRSIIAWPAEVGAPFTDLYDTLSGLMPHHVVEPIDELGGIGEAVDVSDADAVVLVLDPEATSAIGDRELAAALAVMGELPNVSVATVVSDGYLGSDVGADATSLLGAMAVSGVRSLGLRRHRPARSNAVCVPRSSFGTSSELRGPLRQRTETADVAHALAFLLGDTGRYISGEVLFVNGGRHLFSSHTA